MRHSSETDRNNRSNLSTRAKVLSFLGVGMAYLLLVTLAYQSLVLHFSTAIPGIEGRERDYPIFYWNLWWFQHAVLHLQQNPFYTNYVLFPHTINLAFHTFSPFLGLIAIPVYTAFGPAVAVNSLIIVSLVFSAMAMFAFLRYHFTPIGLAFLGGTFFIFTSFVNARLTMSHLNMLPIGWLPLGLLAWDWLVRRRTWAPAVVLSGILYAALLTDQQFAVWLALLLVPYALYQLFHLDRRSRQQVMVLSGLMVAIVVALVVIMPLPELLDHVGKPYHQISFEGAQLNALAYTDLIGFPARLSETEHVTLGILLPLVAIISVFRGRGAPWRLFWLVMALVFLILALGPTLVPFNIPLPYRLIHILLGGIYRTPARFILPCVFALILFITFSLRADYQRLDRVGRIACVIGVLAWLAFENRWYAPFPVFNAPDYRVYHAIGSEPDEFMILEVPVGPNNTAVEEFGHGRELEYYAVFHHKQLINGAISRAPIGTTHDYRQWPLITALAEEGPLPDLTQARAEFQQLSQTWDMRYALIHRDLLSNDVANWAVRFLNTQAGWCLVDEEGPLLAYRRMDGGVCPQPDLLKPPADGMIQIGDGNDDRYLGFGWYPAENVGGPQARWTGEVPTATVQVKLAAQPYRVTLFATAYPEGQQVTAEANGQRVAEFAVGAGWHEYTFDLPPDFIGPDGMMTLSLIPARVESAYERTNGQVDDRRPLAIAIDAMTFTPVSDKP